MTELTCQQCQDIAAELALNVLSCHERADALTHLAGCTTCQDTVSALTDTADRLVELLPTAQPPAGFEQRVIRALAPLAPRARRWWMPTAAGLVAIALAAAGWIAGHSTDTDAPAQASAQPDERTVMYAPLTTTQHQIGHAYIHPGRPSWIYLAIDGGAASNTVHCEMVRPDGSAVRVGTFPLTDGHGAWGGPAPEDGAFTTARLIDNHGSTLATAHFGSPPRTSDRPEARSHSHRRLRHPQ